MIPDFKTTQLVIYQRQLILYAQLSCFGKKRGIHGADYSSNRDTNNVSYGIRKRHLEIDSGTYPYPKRFIHSIIPQKHTTTFVSVCDHNALFAIHIAASTTATSGTPWAHTTTLGYDDTPCAAITTHCARPCFGVDHSGHVIWVIRVV
jgi:hypothetical protein